MNTIKIPFKGITRNTDDELSPDGECMELINARVANGSIEPVSKPILIKSLDEEYKKIYYHQKADRYIAIKSDGTLVCITSDFNVVTALSYSITNAIEVSFIGLIVCVLTENGVKYMRWKAGSYLYLGDIPELPEIKITYTTTTAVETVQNPPNLDISSQESCSIWSEFSYGYWLKTMDKLNRQGYFLHSTCIRVAYRLYDGTYIKHSPVRCVLPTGEVRTGISHIDTGVGCRFGYFKDENASHTLDGKEATFASIGFKPVFTTSTFDYSQWEDLIVSIDIFASPSMRYQYTGYRVTFLGDERPAPLKAMTDIAEFYKIASIDLKGNLKYPTGNVSPSSLALEPQLSDDNLTHNKILSGKSYVYNSRLHLYELKTKLFSGYSKDYLFDNSELSTSVGTIDVYVYIATERGNAIVHRQFTNTTIPTKITPYIMYPDSRAYKAVIRIKSGSNIRIKEFSLVSHSKLNAAFSLENDKPEDVTSWSTTDIEITPIEIIEEDYTKLKVSALNNPFYFPPRVTYQFQSEIIAIQSNTTALSQGQFGQHPLYVFTKDGVYAMSTGVNDVVYSNIIPVSRDVCTNSNVCGIDSSVLFATDRGLMSISGNTVVCISQALEGFLPSCTISSPVIPKILDIVDMKDKLSDVTFNEYVKESVLGFNYADSEVIVSNPAYGYCYVFNFKSAQWHKIDYKINSFINSYPNTFAVSGKKIYNPYNPHRSVAKIALVTRPIKLGSQKHKRLFQCALRSILKRSLSDLYLRGEAVQFRGEELTIFSDLGFYILGSEDGEHFTFLVGRESIVDIRDLVTKANKTKACKYFMVCLVGGVRSDVSVNYLEVIAEEAFGNRLR